jgi:Bacterial tandem repeat domain 1
MTTSRRCNRARITATLAAFALTVLLAVAPTAVSAHPGLPSDVFDPFSVSWASIRDHTPAAFDTEVDDRRDADYIVTDIDADAAGASYRLSAVFQRNLDDRDWALGHGLTLNEYLDFRTDSITAGMRSADFETYVLGGVRYYAALFVENVEGYSWVSQRHLSQTDLATFLTSQDTAGRIVVDIDHYAFGAGTAYAAIAIENDENLSWEVEYNRTSADFDMLVDSYYDDDFRLLMIDSVETANGQRFTGIFVRNVNGRGAPAQAQLTSAGFHDAWSDFAEDDYRLITQERYETAAGTRYLGVWRQND